ncbi:hypothetical protein LOK46_10225 [Methylobacterium sp. NMS14P]|uniref:hypothetical protein n=1 Tax=Methylobacterium sp. NMS14P TaxID=2894310 RepID=UPI0023582C59|nr:hypothetical protein [Methylobacterium sp. NMS14P]WCS27165.1 hypothetical protein LOK46_10225 [Methylobacterium sp. NMS14P]
MFGSVTPSAHASAEYEAIEATISASERGRWFLAEYARRNRGAETEVLLGAIARLERSVTADRGQEAFGHLRGNLLDMADAISRTKGEIAALNAPNSDETRLTQASLALDAIVRETEQATSDILSAAESIQEAAWTLREHGADAQACDALDRHATAIYTACSFQDLTAQRTARIVYTLRYLEDRVSAMIAIWGEDAVRVPPHRGARPAGEPADLNQSDIDRYIAMDVPAVTVAALVARPGSPALHEDLMFLPVPEEARAPEAETVAETAAETAAEAPAEPEPVAEVEPDAVSELVGLAALGDALGDAPEAAPAGNLDAGAKTDLDTDWAVDFEAVPETVPEPAPEAASPPVADSSAEAAPEPDAAIEDRFEETFEEDFAQDIARDVADLTWGETVAAAPEPAMPPEEPALSFAEIDALTPEQRLALFA